MKLKRSTCAAGLGIAVVVLTAVPAQANDFTGTYVATDGTTAARGWWDDSVDTLCAKGFYFESIQPWAEAEINPVDGSGPSFTIRDNNTNDDARTCTGNLSIPEDQLYRMTVRYKRIGSTCPAEICSKAVGTFYS